MSRAANSDDPAAAYRAICAGRRDGDPAVQDTWALPHHSNPGDPPNAAGVRNALSRLPQTYGLTNKQAAQDHLDAHMSVIQEENAPGDAAEDKSSGELSLGAHMTLNVPGVELETLSLPQRRLGLRLLEYNKVVDSSYGPLMFEPGAFFTDFDSGEVDPTEVRLRMDHADPPTGKGRSFTDKADAPYMDFQLSKTQRADEQLTLARDGVSRGASVGYDPVTTRMQSRQIGGRAVTVFPPRSARLAEVSTTWQPTFAGDAVTHMLHKQEGAPAPMAENDAPVNGANITASGIGLDYDKLAQANAAAVKAVLDDQRDAGNESKLDTVLAKFDQMIELQRESFKIPSGEAARKPKLHDWVEITLRRMRGDSISPSQLKTLALDDVITSEQPGLVPTVLTPDYDDLINQDRPFLTTTRQVAPPATGTSMILPIITQRATGGTQAGGEKTDLTTTSTKVGTGTFPYVSVFGGADVAIQMINRAEASFFDILTGDMGMAYALDSDEKAIAALLNGYTDSASTSHVPVDGGDLDPENPFFGVAWQNSIVASLRPPDTIWMSSTAVQGFIDAKAPLTNAPLYSNLAAAFTAGGGTGGSLSGLRPVYVRALDLQGVDVIIGPSRGFVWAEDPARTLQVDVPSKAGRDIALVGGLFLAPRFANAFTVYTVVS